MIAIYARKSVEKEGSKSTKEQSLRGKDLAKKLKMPFEVYIDEGISGTWDISKRPEFSRMLDDIDDGKIKVVYAYHNDRIERNPQTRYFFNDLLRKNEVKLYTDNGEVDLYNDEQEMLGDMMSVMSKYYVRTTKRRVKNSVARNISEGKIHGILAYGYMCGENKTMVINPEEAEVVKLIYKLSLEGNGYINIAKELTARRIPTRYAILKDGGIQSTGTYKIKNIYTGEVVVKEKGSAPWQQASIRGIFYNELNKGIRRHSDIYLKVPQLTIIDETTWNKTNRRLKANEKPRGKDSNHKYLLNGVVFCGTCEKRLTGRMLSTRGQHAYRCVDKRQKQGNRCDNRDILGGHLETIIWNRLFVEGRLLIGFKEHLLEKKKNPELELLDAKLENLKARLKQLESNKSNVLDLIFKGILKESQIKTRLGQAEVEIDDCKIQIEHIKDSLMYHNVKQSVSDDAEKDLDSIKASLPFGEKQEIIRKYIKDIKISYQTGMYVVVISFHLDMAPEFYTVDTKYNLAIEGLKGVVLPISAKYKEIAKKDTDLRADAIYKKLMMEQFKIGFRILNGSAEKGNKSMELYNEG